MSDAGIFKGRYTTNIEGDFVVFIIGMRPHRLWRLDRWMWVSKAMRAMLTALSQHKEKGLLGFSMSMSLGGPVIIQYWRSFEDLDRFAKNPDDPHLGPWRRYNKELGKTAEVGIWHETYKVRAGEYEAIYTNMPRVGLAAAGDHIPVTRKGHSAARRIGATAADDVVVPEEGGD